MKDNEDDFVWVKGKLRKGSGGENLGAGGFRRDDGTLSALVYDTEIIAGEKVSAKTPKPKAEEEDDYTPQAYEPEVSMLETVVEAIHLLEQIVVLANEVGPPVIKWVREKAIPAIQERKRRRQSSSTIAAKTPRDLPSSSQESPVDASMLKVVKTAEMVLQEPPTEITREEAQRLLDEMHAAAKILDEHKRRLRNARISDDAPMQALPSAQLNLPIARVFVVAATSSEEKAEPPDVEMQSVELKRQTPYTRITPPPKFGELRGSEPSEH